MKLYAAALNFRPIAEEFEVPTDFPPELHIEAQQASDRFASGRVDRRDIEFVTIDPVGSMDLDQAVCIEKREGNYRVYYAIADVMAFIAPGTALEQESFRRGQTIYLPDEPARLHPEEISEGAASLLPDVDRPAVLWTFDLDPKGEVRQSHVERAVVRSRARLDYDGVQADYEKGALHPSIAYLPDVGKLRQASALRRSAVNLRMPSERVERREDGRYELELEPRLASMEWNSEISLLTGMVAGQMMAAHGVGLLRTLGPADDKALRQFAVEAQALGFDYHKEQPVGEFIADIDVTTNQGMAVMREAQKLLRGADYVVLAGAPAKSDVHAGVGGYYAHVTAPLRRLADRFATEVCLALASGKPIPDWALSRLPEVAESMRRTTTIASNVDRACLRLTEATVLAPHVGDEFQAIVLATMPEQGKCRIFVEQPPMLCGCLGTPEEATEVKVRLANANIAERTVSFTWPA